MVPPVMHARPVGGLSVHSRGDHRHPSDPTLQAGKAKPKLADNPKFEIALIDEVFKCPSCERIYTTDDDIEHPIYECVSCGNMYTRRQTENEDNRCPSCNKFGSKLYDQSCEDDCTEELESYVALSVNGAVYVPLELAREETV